MLGEGEGVDTFTDGLGGGALLTVCAGAVRANSVAKPTVASAPTWVAPQVRRDSRRSPVVRAAPSGSEYRSRTRNEKTTVSVKGQ
jgi:hypothetical protein